MCTVVCMYVLGSVFESNGMESPSKFFLGSNLILDLGSIIESDLSKKRKSEPN